MRRMAASALALAGSILACGERTNETATISSGPAEPGGIAVVCTNVWPESLDPFVSADLVAADLRTLIFTPLVLHDSAGGVRPHLAERWEWRDSQRALRFTVRRDLKWHDGQPVSAYDVAWTLGIAADSSYTYSGWDNLRAITNATAVDSATVDVSFSEAFTAGLEPFTQLPILPRHLLGQVPAAEFARAEYHRAPVGSGPFRFAGRSADNSIQFDRFADYPESLGRAHLDRIVLRGVPEAASMMIELQTGGIDLCVTGSSMARQIDAAPELDAQPLAPAGVQVIELAIMKPPFDDARVRRAASAALVRSEIAAAISPLARPARTFLPAGAERWLDPSLLEPDADSALAAALLDSAGWNVVGSDGIRRNAAGEPFRFTIAAPQGFQDPLTVVQAQLRRAGIDARLEFMEGAAFLGMIRNPASRPAAIAVSLFPDRFVLPDPTGQLHSAGGVNLTGYANPQVDSLIGRLSQVIPDTERAAIYHALQRHLAEDLHILYTVYFPRVIALGSRLQDVRVDLNGPFSSVAAWWIPAAERR